MMTLVRIEHIDVPGWIVREVEERCSDKTWSEVISESLAYVIDEADRARAEVADVDDIEPTPPSAA